MGLDITAYSQLKSIGRHTEDWCDDEDHIKAFAYDCFPKSFRGIPVLGERTVGRNSSFIEGGCFVETDATETHAFKAGSYGGYNAWRANLASQFNPAPIDLVGLGMQEPDPDGPFYELIWFADNKGSIGPEAAADLLSDFRAHTDRYQAAHQWHREVYGDWTRAFELAADGGLVRFH